MKEYPWRYLTVMFYIYYGNTHDFTLTLSIIDTTNYIFNLLKYLTAIVPNVKKRTFTTSTLKSRYFLKKGANFFQLHV